MYCTTEQVYRATKLTTTDVDREAVKDFIKSAEREVDRFTFTTHWNREDNGTATSATNNTLSDTSKVWYNQGFEGGKYFVWIYGGTGSGQIRKISTNNATSLTVERNWSTNPDNTSTYRILYSGTDAYFSSLLDGTGTDTLFIPNYPTRLIESITINSTSVTVSSIYDYGDIGKVQLSDTSEKQFWDRTKPQLVNMPFWFGVYPISEDIIRYCIILAAIKTLSAQMGGTHNIPSTYAMPEGSVTVGQAYINIEQTRKTLREEKKELEKVLIRYPTII